MVAQDLKEQKTGQSLELIQHRAKNRITPDELVNVNIRAAVRGRTAVTSCLEHPTKRFSAVTDDIFHQLSYLCQMSYSSIGDPLQVILCTDKPVDRLDNDRAERVDLSRRRTEHSSKNTADSMQTTRHGPFGKCKSFVGRRGSLKHPPAHGARGSINSSLRDFKNFS